MEQPLTRTEKGWFAPGNSIGAESRITADNARDMLRRRAEKRARLATEGALRSVQDAALVLEYGDDAPLVERAQTLQTIASTVDAGKAAVMASQYLDKLQGYTDTPEDVSNVVDSVALLLRELAQFVGDAFDNSHYRNHDEPAWVGGEVSEQGEEANGGVVDGVVGG